MSRVRPQVGPTISLFPFLAVLLCTMGALLVLLVIFSSSAGRAEAQAANQAAAAEAAAAAKAMQDELELARDEMAWRIDQMKVMRARTMDDLARARMQLAGIEADSRALVDELDEFERTAAALAAEPEPSEESTEDLEKRLAAARDRLEKARKGAADRPPAYAVVPYDGPSGTRRRPLYIECCIDGVFLQPEGIRLSPSDFEGPPGPGNPLASALRAAREHLASQPGESGDPNTQPYPLLLVRPSGVMAYYAARESLQSWGSDFGYQFIDEDWSLTYPPADPALAAAESRAIEEARRRLEWLAQVRPQKRPKPAVQYRAATTRGGVVAANGPSVLGDQSRFDWTEQSAGGAAAPGRGFRGGGSGDGQGDAVLGNGGGGGQAQGDSRWTSAGGGSPGGTYVGPSKFYGGAGDSQTPGAGNGLREGGSGEQAAGGAAGANRSSGVSGTQGANGPGSGNSHGPGGDGTMAGGGAGQFAGGQSGSAGGSPTGSTASSSGQSVPGGGGSSGQSMPGAPQSASASFGGPAAFDANQGAASLAGRRGSNWASLASQSRPIPITRPIRMECARDEFRILGEGGRVITKVPISGATVDAVDPLVREVHATVGSWGMAGDRMYWRPELVLSATPDGTARLAELEQLLADSGLDTRRSATPRDAVRPLPPVYRTRTGHAEPAASY